MKQIITTIVLISCLSPIICVGQPVLPGNAGVEQRHRPGQQQGRQVLPLIEPQPAKPATLVLPPVVQPAQSDDLSLLARVFVQRFDFIGNQVISDKELTNISRSYQGRLVSFEQLQQLRSSIGQYYLAQGYVNSGAIIPDQKVIDQVIQIQIVEGRLMQVEISGSNNVSADYLKARLQQAAGTPLNVNGLEKELKSLQQNPLIKRLNAELRPGDALGEAILLVRVEEDRAVRAHIALNNHRPPSVGAEQVELDFSWLSPTGNNDQLTTQLAHTEGLDDAFVTYHVPVNAYDTRVGAYFEYTESEVVEQPFDVLDIESDATTWGINVTHPLYRTQAGHLIAGLALERRQSNSTLSGVPFSFAEGVNNGRADVTPLRASIDWLQRDTDNVYAVRVVLNVGLDAFNITKNGDAADARFASLFTQAQWLRRFGDRGYQMVLKTSAQLSNDALLPMEKFAVGGYSTVRGYRENQLVRDNGYIASAELRIPLFVDTGEAARWSIAPFIDYGNAWEDSADTPRPRDIASIGLALRWQPTSRLSMSVTAASTSEDLDPVNQDQNLQDRGVHLAIDYQLF